MSFQLSLALGLGFGFLAAMMAFVIVFEAYRRQQFQAGRIWRESLIAATFAFAFFFPLVHCTGLCIAWGNLKHPRFLNLSRSHHETKH
jgi:hypothetical protein